MITVKNDWGKKKSLIGFLSANKIDSYNRWYKKGKQRKKSKRLYKTSQKIRIINVFLQSLLSESFPSQSHSPPHLPRRPSNTVLISGRVVGEAQILIWSYSSVFLPPVSTAIRTSAFSFVGALSDLLYVSQTQRLPSYCVDVICSLYSWWEGFGSSSLATLPLGFNWFYFHLCMQVLHCDLAPGAALEGQGLPLWGPGVEVVQLLWLQGFWQHQVLGGTGGRQLGQQEIQCPRGYGNQYWPVHSSILDWGIPSLTEKPGRPQSTGPQSQTRP